MTSQIHTLKHSRIIQRSPIYYGWVVAVVATIGLCATAPGQSFSVSLFIDHYITDFGLDRTTVSGLYGLGTSIAALSLTLVGRRIDRHGNRRMSVVIALCYALALMASALVAGPLGMLLSFIAIRGLGQGAMGLVNSTAIAQWFQRRRGRVIGISLVSFALFQRVYVPFMQSFIETSGWRVAWLGAGLFMLLIILPLLGLLLRDKPEAFGLVPDGNAKDLPEASNIPEDNWKLSEALRTPIFWAFTFARMLAGAWGTALIFHQVSIFGELGHSPVVAASSYGQIALMTAGFTLISGYLVDRLRPAFMIVIQMSALIATMSLAMTMTGPTSLVLYTIMFGSFMGVGSVFDGSVWVALFGRQNQGAIRGFVAMMGVMGTAIGPLVFGVAFDNSGTYGPALWIGIVLALIAIGLALLVKKPSRTVAANTAAGPVDA